jgi:GTP-binding protein
MLDSELIEELKKELPTEIPSICISSLSGLNLTELKDLIWQKINENPIKEIVHKPIEIQKTNKTSPTEIDEFDEEEETDSFPNFDEFEWDD